MLHPAPGDSSYVEHLRGSTHHTVAVNGRPCFGYESETYWEHPDRTAVTCDIRDIGTSTTAITPVQCDSFAKRKRDMPSMKIGVAALAFVGLICAQAAAQGVPVNTGPPAITGSAEVGQTLTAGNGTWTNAPTGFTRQWRRNGKAIDGATGTTYVLVGADVAQRITVSVTASNARGDSAPAASAGTAQVIQTVANVNAKRAWYPAPFSLDPAVIVRLDALRLNSTIDSAPGTFPIPPATQPADKSNLGKWYSMLIVMNNYKRSYSDSNHGKSIVVGGWMNSGKFEAGNTDWNAMEAHIAASGNPTLIQGLHEIKGEAIRRRLPVAHYFDVGCVAQATRNYGLRASSSAAPPFSPPDEFTAANGHPLFTSSWDMTYARFPYPPHRVKQ